MAIGDVLMSQRRWGSTRCRKFLATFQITEAKTVGSLTERQRTALASRLDAAGAKIDDDRRQSEQRLLILSA